MRCVRKIVFEPCIPVRFQSCPVKDSGPFDALVPMMKEKQKLDDSQRETICEIDERACFFIRSCLSREECRQIISAAEASGFEYRQFEGNGKDSASCIVESVIFAETIFQRIGHLAPETSYFDAGLGIVLSDIDFDNQEVKYWGKIKGINCSIRVERYGEGQRLKIHRDGLVSVKYQENTYTIFAILIYLNDDYEEGYTKFAVSKNPKNPNDLYDFVDLRGNLGDALVFRHEILHCGSPVSKSCKYVLRLDFTYEILNQTN